MLRVDKSAPNFEKLQELEEFLSSNDVFAQLI